MELDPKCAACIAWGNNGKCEGQLSGFESSACHLCQKYINEPELKNALEEDE